MLPEPSPPTTCPPHGIACISGRDVPTTGGHPPGFPLGQWQHPAISSYAIGSPTAPSICGRCRRDLDVGPPSAPGKLTAINRWLEEKIWKYGCMKGPHAPVRVRLRPLPSGGVRGVSGKEVHGDIRIVISHNDNTKYYRPGALHKALRGDFSVHPPKIETLSCLSSADNGQKGL